LLFAAVSAKLLACRVIYPVQSGGIKKNMLKTGIMCGVLCGAMAVGTAAAADTTLFLHKVGRFEVFMLVENQGGGRTSILRGASEAQIKQYLPNGTYQSETNTFIVRSPDSIIVIDTGFGGALFEGMKKLGIAPEQVDAVLLTHLHGDHIGGLAKNGKALFPKAAIYLAGQEKEYWTVTAVNQGAVTALAPYSAVTKTFAPGGLNTNTVTILPGINAVAAFGHTPGHTMYLLESEGSSLLIWGDLMHVQDIQFPVPSISVSYDTDPAAAAVVRVQVLEYAAKTGTPVAGMHLVYPAMGTVTTEKSGFRFNQFK
jgi:glyoxylase-like metal-dependent hydrolase (beta-lactamase superfamily II)